MVSLTDKWMGDERVGWSHVTLSTTFTCPVAWFDDGV